MIIYELIGKDVRENVCLFSEWAEADGVRARYSHLRCRKCGKIDEIQALSYGFDDFHIRSKWDWFVTDDNWTIVSERIMELFTRIGIEGLRYLQIQHAPNLFNRYVLINDNEVQTGFTEAGFRQCGEICCYCHRSPEIVSGPIWQGIKISKSEKYVFRSNIWNENLGGKYHQNFATKDVVEDMKKSKITGIEYIIAR